MKLRVAISDDNLNLAFFGRKVVLRRKPQYMHQVMMLSPFVANDKYFSIVPPRSKFYSTHCEPSANIVDATRLNMFTISSNDFWVMESSDDACMWSLHVVIIAAVINSP